MSSLSQETTQDRFAAQPGADGSSASVAEPAQLKAALWDMDGTLVDTEPYWIAAETELVRSHGGYWDEHLAQQLVGSALDDSARVFQNAGVNLSVREIIDYLSQQVIAGVKEHLPWRPGAQELLAELHSQGVRCVLVTMSEGPLAREVVSALAGPYFEFLVTGDQVENGKPHPEPYLSAIERLRESDPTLTAENCVAFEDSVPGVASATAAGVTTIAIPNVAVPAAGAAHVMWSSMAEKNYDDVTQVLRQFSPTPGAAS